MTKGKFSLYENFESCKIESRHEAYRLIYPDLDQFPGDDDPVSTMSWSQAGAFFVFGDVN